MFAGTGPAIPILELFLDQHAADRDDRPGDDETPTVNSKQRESDDDRQGPVSESRHTPEQREQRTVADRVGSAAAQPQLECGDVPESTFGGLNLSFHAFNVDGGGKLGAGVVSADRKIFVKRN